MMSVVRAHAILGRGVYATHWYRFIPHRLGRSDQLTEGYIMMRVSGFSKHCSLTLFH